MSDAGLDGAEGYVHATALVVREAGVLVRGASGAGKSRLALLLIAEARRQKLFARLVGDDRVALAAHAGRLVARGHPAVAGRVERRGEGIVAAAHEPVCVIRTVIDLVPHDLPRWPETDAGLATVCSVEMRRLALRAGLVNVDVADVLDRLAVAAAL